MNKPTYRIIGRLANGETDVLDSSLSRTAAIKQVRECLRVKARSIFKKDYYALYYYEKES